MCMFNDLPKEGEGIIEERVAWKVFTRGMGGLHFPIITDWKPIEEEMWLSYKQNVFSNGFHVFRSRFGALSFRFSMKKWDTYPAMVVKKVMVRGRVFGVGWSGFFRGFRVEQMFVPKE